MSDQPEYPNRMNKPVFPKLEVDTEKLQESLGDIRGKAQEALRNPQGPEVQEAVEQTKSFIERNQKTIVAGIVVVVGLRVYRRKIAKATAKMVSRVVSDAIQKDDLAIKEQLNELTLAVEDLALYAWDKRYAKGGILRSVTDEMRSSK